MVAKSKKTDSSGPSFAGSLIADLMNVRKQKVVELKAVRNARISAEELEAVIASGRGRNFWIHSAENPFDLRYRAME